MTIQSFAWVTVPLLLACLICFPTIGCMAAEELDQPNDDFVHGSIAVFNGLLIITAVCILHLILAFAIL